MPLECHLTYHCCFWLGQISGHLLEWRSEAEHRTKLPPKQLRGYQVVTLPNSMKAKADDFSVIFIHRKKKKKKSRAASDTMACLCLMNTVGLIAGHVPLFALAVRKLRHEFASHLENFSAALVAPTSAY